MKNNQSKGYQLEIMNWADGVANTKFFTSSLVYSRNSGIFLTIGVVLRIF